MRAPTSSHMRRGLMKPQMTQARDNCRNLDTVMRERWGVNCWVSKPIPATDTAHDGYVQGDALPVPEVIEKDSDSVWALWSDVIKETPDKDLVTQPATLMMGLHELPKDTDA